MNDRILHKYTGRSADPDTGDELPPENEPADDLGFFGWLRGSRERAVSLELRKKDGSIEAESYALLERASFDPSEGITLRFTGRTVRIRGINLNGEARPHIRLFQGIARHRVPWVQEADEPASIGADENATVIEKIEWE